MIRLRILLVALLPIVASACASSGAVPRPFPVPGAAGRTSDAEAPPGVTSRAPVSSDGYAIAGTALALQGAPYRSGGADPAGFDCSGLVQYVLAQHGITWPRVVREQYERGHDIDPDTLQPGDLVFFVTEGRSVSHVGIAIGGDQFVHAPNARGVVRVDSLSSAYWGDRFAGARRIE